MENVIDLVIPAFKQVKKYAENLLVGIEPSSFARLPVVNGETININHPAFTYGHLSLYPGRIAGIMQLQDKELAAPDSYKDLFAIGSKCLDDQAGSIYPSMDELVKAFTFGHNKLLEVLPYIKNEAFFKVNEEERTKERFPTVGSFLVYLLTAHINTHLGQVSSWRRCVGLPPT